MLSLTRAHRARGINKKTPRLWGAPGAPIIRMISPVVQWRYRNFDIVVEHTHRRRSPDSRLLHYLGKHCPHPQKSLWSADTPVPQDRHLFQLTTLDIDAFKYWFGVKRCQVHGTPWIVLHRAGLLPPSLYSNSKLMPRPVFHKEQLMRYYLANRRPAGEEEKRDYTDYISAMTKTPKQEAADRPVAPWL